MNLAVIGSYTITIPLQNMFLNSELTIKNKNLITLLGESFFLNRAINDDLNPIQYICLGTGKNRASKSDIQLGNETIRGKCIKSVDLDNKQIILTKNFPSKDVLGTTEIGIHNGKILISHDVYEKIDDEFLTPSIGDVTINYMFQFTTGSSKTGWAKTNDYSNVYYVVEPNTVVGVSENECGAYRSVPNIATVNMTKGSFYYDISSKNLYIHTLDDGNPNNKDLIVQL